MGKNYRFLLHCARLYYYIITYSSPIFNFNIQFFALSVKDLCDAVIINLKTILHVTTVNCILYVLLFLFLKLHPHKTYQTTLLQFDTAALLS